jgi:hypothetical protein
MLDNRHLHRTWPVGFFAGLRNACTTTCRFTYSFQVTVMTIASILRTSGLAAFLATPLLLSPNLLSAQEQLTPPSQTRVIGAPVGHRQPRAADIPATNPSATDLVIDRQQAELSRKLRICRGC